MIIRIEHTNLEGSKELVAFIVFPEVQPEDLICLQIRFDMFRRQVIGKRTGR